ncbi:MAG: GxxExxY protein [Lewinella sp.]|uniref:GxxExxY protein n=1 Tax=Lewinella sp. TaxID=2004506 RepID=UPI003D6C52B6
MRASKKVLDELTYQVIGAAIEVHKSLGPGLLESVYHRCLAKQLSLQGLSFSSEHLVPVHYKGEKFDTLLRCDFLVEDLLIVEIKSVAAFAPIFNAQLLTYMNLLCKPKGLLMNFNVVNIFQEGQQTMVNETFRTLPEL